MIHYPFDDDPPPAREQPGGDMRQYSQLVEDIRRSFRVRMETPYRTRNTRRNLVILLCYRLGLSMRAIGDVFDLSQTAVKNIIAALEEEYAPARRRP